MTRMIISFWQVVKDRWWLGLIEGNDYREILYRAIFRVGLKLPSLVVDKVTIKGEGVVDREVYREVDREVERRCTGRRTGGVQGGQGQGGEG